MKRSLVLASIIVLLTAVGSVALAQGPGPGGGQGSAPGYSPGHGHGEGPDGWSKRGGLIHKLNRVLESLEAPALDSDQEAEITALIEAHRQSLPKPDGERPGLELHAAYAEAILNGDPVEDIIVELAEMMAVHMAERMQRQAEFASQVLDILNPNQLAALRELNPQRLVGLLSGGGGRGFRSMRAGEGHRVRPTRN